MFRLHIFLIIKSCTSSRIFPIISARPIPANHSLSDSNHLHSLLCLFQLHPNRLYKPCPACFIQKRMDFLLRQHHHGLHERLPLLAGNDVCAPRRSSKTLQIYGTGFCISFGWRYAHFYLYDNYMNMKRHVRLSGILYVHKFLNPSQTMSFLAKKSIALYMIFSMKKFGPCMISCLLHLSAYDSVVYEI